MPADTLIAAQGNEVTSTTILEADVTYVLRALGNFNIGVVPPGADGECLADAEYGRYDPAGINACGPFADVLQEGTDMGIGINTPYEAGLDPRPFRWGDFNPEHFYEQEFVGLGEPIVFNYFDCPGACYTDNTQNDMRVEIYGPPPSIEIEKSGSGPDPLTVGATIDYEFLVTNTGIVTMTNVTVTDPLPGLSPISCPDTTLAPGAEMTCTATYEVTQADVEAGVVENTATVTGDDPNGGPTATDESTAMVPPTVTPGIEIEKSGSGPDPLTVGSTIDYEFLVTNTGNVTLTNVTVTDPLPGLSPISCPNTTLAPGAQMTCTATYTVTQADVDAGVVENTATATGETPTGGPPPTDESTTTVPPTPPVPSLPTLALVLLVALLATTAFWTLRRRARA